MQNDYFKCDHFTSVTKVKSGSANTFFSFPGNKLLIDGTFTTGRHVPSKDGVSITMYLSGEVSALRRETGRRGAVRGRTASE